MLTPIPITNFTPLDILLRIADRWTDAHPDSVLPTALSKVAANARDATADADRSKAHGLARYIQVRAPKYKIGDKLPPDGPILETEADVDAANEKKRNKYNARKTKIGNLTFDSGLEAARYLALVEMEKAGEINHLKVQPRFNITIGGIPIMRRSNRYPNGRHLTYVADFSYTDTERLERIIEDVKGQRTDVYKIKKALMEAMGYKVKEV